MTTTIKASLTAFALLVLYSSPPARGDETTDTLEAIRSRHELPAIAVVVIKDGQVCDRGAVGVRKLGEPTPVTLDDQFHIGSCTKAMTSTLAAMLIEAGKLRWNTTIVEALPELKGKIHRDYEAVTIEQLLQNRGGLATEPPAKAWQQAWRQKGTVREQRYEFIAAALAEPPAAKPGQEMIYSNQGFTIAGVMLERAAGQPWEELMAEQLFKPLGMKSAGFGPPGSADMLDQPWGHAHSAKKYTPLHSDNPPAIGPAGRVHCSLEDFAQFVQLHLGAATVPQLLQPATLKRLHAPPAGVDYACGWVALDRPWAKGKALTHNGSNTMWYAVMWLAPKRQFAVISAANAGGPAAEKACDDAAAAMIGKWLK